MMTLQEMYDAGYSINPRYYDEELAELRRKEATYHALLSQLEDAVESDNLATLIETSHAIVAQFNAV
jgi:hypothetical protein